MRNHLQQGITVAMPLADWPTGFKLIKRNWSASQPASQRDQRAENHKKVQF